MDSIGIDRGHGTRSPLRFDSPWFSGRSLIVTDHAKRCLEELLDENTELLPARLEGESLWLIHVMSAENCVNQRESVISRTTSGEVRGFFEYQFNEEAVEPLTLFGIPEEMVCHPLCTDSFKNRVEECGLTGLEFKLVWDSELPVGSHRFQVGVRVNAKALQRLRVIGTSMGIDDEIKELTLALAKSATRPALPFEIDERVEEGFPGSKLGGSPLMPPGAEWPIDGKGRPSRCSPRSIVSIWRCWRGSPVRGFSSFS